MFNLENTNLVQQTPISIHTLPAQPENKRTQDYFMYVLEKLAFILCKNLRFNSLMYYISTEIHP